MKENPKAEMERIAKEMAAYFSSHVTPTELVVWLLKAGDMIIDYTEHKDFKKDICTSSLIASFSYQLLPALLEAKSSQGKISVFEKELPGLFFGVSYKGLKMNLQEIANSFFYQYSKLSVDEDFVVPFMKVLSTLMIVVEMYSDYAFYSKEVRNEIELTTA